VQGENLIHAALFSSDDQSHQKLLFRAYILENGRDCAGALRASMTDVNIPLGENTGENLGIWRQDNRLRESGIDIFLCNCSKIRSFSSYGFF
jgi:hypothetical protein